MDLVEDGDKEPEGRGPQSRYWVGTINNPPDNMNKDNFRAFFQSLYDTGAFTYIVVGYEIAPSTGTPHLQCFFVLAKRQHWSWLRTKIGPFWFRVKAKRATAQRASDYCEEDGDFLKLGAIPKDSGAATQELWDNIRSAAIEGRFDDIPSRIYVCQYRALQSIYKDNQSMPINLPPGEYPGMWVYGPPGTGKSWWARHEYPNAYLKTCNKWWDGYKGEEEVIIEDLDPDHCKHLAHHCKIWLDIYAFPCEIKGGKLNARPKKIIITSNYTIEECFNATDAAAIRRRVTLKHVPLPIFPTPTSN